MKHARKSGKRKKAIGRIAISPLLGAGLIFLISLAILLLEMNFRIDGLPAAIRDFTAQPKLWLLNYFPVLMLTAAFCFAFANPFAAGALSALVFGAASYANLLKIEGRSDPMTPADITLIREALGAVAEYKLELHLEKAAVFLIFIAIMTALAFSVKTRRISKPLRIVLPAVLVIVLSVTVKFYYCDSARYYRFETPERYNVAREFEILGFNYCFLYNWNLYPIDKPDGFTKAEVENWEQDFECNRKEWSPIKPHIIFVMGEAFSDLPDEAPFAYDEINDPLAAYKAAAASKNAVSGQIAVSNYAAGTANTEFNVMTGMQTNMIGEGLTSSFRVVRKKTKNIMSVLEKNGYGSLMLHPGKSWFYNRTSVYKNFGIKDLIFEEAFDESDRRGTMISDAAFLEKFKAAIEARISEGDSPLFAYGITIENHQAYNYGKYDEKPAPVPLKIEVSNVSNERLEVYMEGLRANSEMVLELAEWLDTLEDPAILVFFGDHRPNLGDTYKELGLSRLTPADNSTPEAIIASYTVPFFIRANTAYAKSYDVKAAFERCSLKDGMVLSDNYIGAMALQVCGFTDEGPYLEFLNNFRLEVPVYRTNEDAYLLADGTYTDRLNGEQEETISKLRKWTYYRIKY